MEKNNSIGCIVSECKFHAHNEDYCTLDKIKVTKHEYAATNVEGTDCGSFKIE
ncbi:protein of unknown function DUF1540 [Clostridium carboxidivorans P7]|uniref:DUF1540 domain-containing protein n=1 Tax=Clostridium carboxidivorans P7 TaxID=536227 RepID=C6PT48_9CLOT|nr:DUF1540 domain-containing protein [Clostridium carboxidivorans]EET87569.1 protein of unknown function DUF1540 [Clostridium carboxidivorans P7]EFG87335.1 hypothetical protein CLCAR_2859 [Clostridium carboxidivorans P7]